VTSLEVSALLTCRDGELGCGITFVVSARYARAVRRGEYRSLCRRCSNERRSRKPRSLPSDSERRFWLTRFSDEEILEMALALFGAGSLASIRSWRARLEGPQPLSARQRETVAA
jgi:hypothetical protein